MCFCFQPYNECFDIFHLQSENGNWPFLRNKEYHIYKLKEIFSKSNSDEYLLATVMNTY